MLYGDFAWLRDQLLGTLFDNVGYTFADPIVGNVAVKGWRTATPSRTRSARAAPIRWRRTRTTWRRRRRRRRTNPFPTIYTELTEHPENSTDIVCFINSAEAAAVQGITGFVGINDPNIRPASTSAVLIGSLDAQLPARATLLGRVNNCWIVQWNAIPSTYIVAIAVGGTPPLVRRVDPEPELQGFKSQGRMEVFPFFQDNWIRRMGFRRMEQSRCGRHAHRQRQLRGPD
jgi:hypothetical protein